MNAKSLWCLSVDEPRQHSNKININRAHAETHVSFLINDQRFFINTLYKIARTRLNDSENSMQIIHAEIVHGAIDKNSINTLGKKYIGTMTVSPRVRRIASSKSQDLFGHSTSRDSFFHKYSSRILKNP